MERVQLSGHSGAGPTLAARIEADLIEVCWRYVTLRYVEGFGPNDSYVSRYRGMIRGITRCLMMYRKMYVPRYNGHLTTREQQNAYTKRIEKIWIRRVQNTMQYVDECPKHRTQADGITALW